MDTPKIHLPPHPTQKNKSNTRFSWGIFCIILLQLVLIFLSLQNNFNPLDTQKNTDFFHLKKAALKLEELNLYQAAVHCWKNYLNTVSLENKEKFVIYLRIAELLRSNKEYDDALAYYFLAKELSPDEKQTEIVRNIRDCLETIQRFSAMTTVMKERVDASYNKDKAQNNPIAQIGTREIFSDDLNDLQNQEINTRMKLMQVVIPQMATQGKMFRDNMKQQYSSKEGKQHLLQEHLIEEVLWRKAIASDLQKDPLFEGEIRILQKKILAKQVLEKEVNQQIIILPEEIEALYSTQKKRFETSENAKVAIKVFSSEEEANGFKENVTQENFAEVIPFTISLETKVVESYGDLSQISKDILARKETGLHPQTYTTSAGSLVIWVLEYKDKTTKSLAEVKDTIQQEIYERKYQQVFEKYITQLFEEHNVQIFNPGSSPNKEEK